MPLYADAVQRIRRFFTRQQVANIAAIKEVLETSSRTTVFRVLSKIGYQTSYSHAGGYYTLRDIPKFDADGLWSCRGAMFSKHRTLRATILHRVDTASAGHTDRELRAWLGLRVRDALLDIVQARQIDRRSLEGLYLYVSAKRQKAEAQLAQRRRLLSQPPPLPTSPEPSVVIEVLLAHIHHFDEDAAALASRLKREGGGISRRQIETVFLRYGLGKKKGGPDSRRSRRCESS